LMVISRYRIKISTKMKLKSAVLMYQRQRHNNSLNDQGTEEPGEDTVGCSATIYDSGTNLRLSSFMVRWSKIPSMRLISSFHLVILPITSSISNLLLCSSVRFISSTRLRYSAVPLIAYSLGFISLIPVAIMDASLIWGSLAS